MEDRAALLEAVDSAEQNVVAAAWRFVKDLEDEGPHEASPLIEALRTAVAALDAASVPFVRKMVEVDPECEHLKTYEGYDICGSGDLMTICDNCGVFVTSDGIVDPLDEAMGTDSSGPRTERLWVPLPPPETRLGRTEAGPNLIGRIMDPGHWAIQGQTGSGKSVLVYNLLMSLSRRPDVVIAGIDPSNILLNPFRDHPHPEWRHVGARDMEAAADTFDRLVEEMDRRQQWLTANDLDKMPAFTPDMPLIVIVLEEYPGLQSLARSSDAKQGRKPAERVALAMSSQAGPSVTVIFGPILVASNMVRRAAGPASEPML